MIGRRRWLLSSLLGALLFAGCDPATTLFFLMPEEKEPPELKRLASQDKNKEVTVLILTYAAMDPPIQLLNADRQIAQMLAKQLTDLFQADKEKVVVVPPRKVDAYKSQHSSRRGLDPVEVGRHFKADKVIYLELTKLSLYEQGAGNQLLRGRAEINASVVDVQHPDDTDDPQPLHYVYPADSHGPAAEDLDTPLPVFRQRFLAYVAKRLSWAFAPHAKHDREVEVENWDHR
jgi:hypothetical protein